MSTEPVVSDTNLCDSGIAARAATFLAVNHPGPHATKRISRAFGVSVGMAKLLRAGRGWTVARLDQAARVYGRAFGDFVFPPAADEIHDRLDRIERQLSEIINDLRGE